MLSNHWKHFHLEGGMEDEDLQTICKRDAFRIREHNAGGYRIREICEEETEEEERVSISKRTQD